MYEDVFRDDPWLLAEECQDSDGNKKRKNDIQIDSYDNSTTSEQVYKKQKKRFIWPDRYSFTHSLTN